MAGVLAGVLPPICRRMHADAGVGRLAGVPKHSEIGEIIDRFKRMYADGEVEQLRVKFPADDDGLWFFRRGSKSNEVNVESSLWKCPFLVEHLADTRRFYANTIDETVKVLSLLLGGDSPSGVVTPWTGPAPWWQ